MPADTPPADAATESSDPERSSSRDTSWDLRAIGRNAWAVIGITGVLLLVAIVAGRLSLIVVPVILALFPATLLVPVAAKLKSVGVPDSLSALAAMLLGLLVIGGLIGAMVPLVILELPALIDSVASAVREIETFLREDPFELGLPGPSELFGTGEEPLDEVGTYTEEATSAATTAFEIGTGLILLFVILFFYLKDGRRLTQGLISLAPRRRRSDIQRLADRSWETLGSYFRGQLLVALVDAVFIGIGLLALRIPLALPLALLIFFGSLFPLVGAVVTGALAVLVAFADGGVIIALVLLGIILVVQQADGNILQPFIIGRAIDLHPLVVLIAITAGGVSLGILGAFLAVPAAAVIARCVIDQRDEQAIRNLAEVERSSDEGSSDTGPLEEDEESQRPEGDGPNAATD